MASTNRDALEALFRATGGYGWRKKANWNTDARLFLWHGVEVNVQGRVITLALVSNKIKGTIPKDLGNLNALMYLGLSNNRLTGTIPTELGKLTALTSLNLDNNGLTGEIPPSIGQLGKLQRLLLNGNKLRGNIPKELGNLTALKELWLESNGLTGAIPQELERLTALVKLSLGGNGLTGRLPSSLGQLRKLQQLLRSDNKLSGGPAKNESLGAWRERLRRQQKPERFEEEEESAAVRLGSPARGGDAGGTSAAPARSTSLSSSSRETGESEHLFRAQVAPLASLEKLAENRENLEEVKLFVEASPVGSFTPGTKCSSVDKLRELDRLAEMAHALCEVASSHMEDKGVQRKELELPPDSKAYCTTVRTGLCNAYLAASVVGSSLVCTNKTGRLGAAGKALQLLSGAVPLVGGLAGFAAAALTAGDRYIQTQRVIKITDMATDAVECCSLARRLAVRLADRVANEAASTTDEAEEAPIHAIAGIGGAAGGSAGGAGAPGGQNACPLPDGASEEDVLHWFVDEVAGYEPPEKSSAIQAKTRLAKAHLHMMLKAVGRDTLRLTNSTEEKVERLLLVVFPAAGRTPMSPVNRPEGPFARSSPVQAPTHGGGPAMVAESAAVPVETADDCAAVQAEAADVAAAQASKAVDVAAMQEEMVKFSAGVQEKMAEFSAMQEKMAEFTAVKAKMAEFSAGMQAKMAELSGMQAKMAELAAMQENMRDSAAIQSEMPDLSAMQAEMTEYSAALTKMAELAPTQAQVGKSQMAEFAAMQPEIAGMQAKIEALERDNKDLLGKVTTMQKNMPKSNEKSAALVGAGRGQALLQNHRMKSTEEFIQELENSERGMSAHSHTLTPDEHQAETRVLAAYMGELDNRMGNMEAREKGGKTGRRPRLFRRGH